MARKQEPSEESTGIKWVKRIAGVPVLGLAAWSALTVAGGVMLAMAAAASPALVALGIGAAAVGVQKTFSHLRTIFRTNNSIDKAASNQPLSRNDNPWKRSVFSRNPVLRAAGGALRLGGGIALAATTGGAGPVLIAATMMISGGFSSVSGGTGMAIGIINRVSRTVSNRRGSNLPGGTRAPAKSSKLGGFTITGGFNDAAQDKNSGPDQPPATPKQLPKGPKGPT